MSKSRLAGAAVFVMLVNACTAGVKPASIPSDTGNIFLPPIPASRPAQLPTSPPVSPAPPDIADPTPGYDNLCTDNLTFVQDITIPDGTQVTPGDKLDKRWQVENSGTCNWDQRYRVRVIAGPDLNAPIEQALFPARSGILAELRMIFTAPSEADRYRSAWQAYNPQGEPFGDPFFIEIIVALPDTPTP